MARKKLKPGVKAPDSGQYQEFGPRGGKKKEVTVPKGTKLPPTEIREGYFQLVDRTKIKVVEGNNSISHNCP